MKTGGGTGGGLLCGLTDNILNTNGTSGVSHGYYNNGDYCQDLPGGDEVSCSTTGLSLNEWKTEFDHGIMRGIASCNNTPGPDMSALESQMGPIYEALNAGTITEEEYMAQIIALQSQLYTLPGATASSNSMDSSSTGQYCWCKMESYTPNGGNACNVSQSSAWVFGYEGNSAGNCAWNCAAYCSSNALYMSALRRALATGSGN